MSNKKLYYDIDGLRKYKMPFNFVIGGRGKGKTFSALTSVVKHQEPFIFMRRTQSEIDLLGTQGGVMTPFKVLNNFHGWTIEPFKLNKYVYSFFETEENEDGKITPIGQSIGLMIALSTIANMRGFDASHIKTIIFDEFIPEKHVRSIGGKHSDAEALAFFNAYETINRNREFDGIEPVQCFFLANSNDLDNPIFKYLNLIGKIENMKMHDQSFSMLPDIGVTITLLPNSGEFERKKKETALYKLTSNTKFENMAINNEFTSNDFSQIGSKPLKEFKPYVRTDEFSILVHKSKNEFYVTSNNQKGKYFDISTTAGAHRLQYSEIGRRLVRSFYNDNITFENFAYKSLFTNTFEL